jgi:hypothetical protein
MDTQLIERIVRVEEELKAQRELMAVRFDAADRRFDDMIGLMDKRSDDARSQSDRRFTSLQWTTIIGFTVVTAAMTLFASVI